MGPHGQRLRGSGSSLHDRLNACCAGGSRQGWAFCHHRRRTSRSDRLANRLPLCAAMQPRPAPMHGIDARTKRAGAGAYGALLALRREPIGGCNGSQWSAVVTVPLLELKDVSKTFRRSRTESVVALGSVNLHVAAGETVALVGESGSGKSTLGRIALGLLAPDTGSVLVAGRQLHRLAAPELRRVRAEMQPIFQDAAAALNPRRSAKGHLLQALAVRGAATETEAIALLESVGLRPGHEYLNRLPHELSGGQRQRLTIARALAPRPRLIIADEPLSGADVSIRGQILNLLLDIKQQRAIAYLMITHDISVARAFADRVAVMTMGKIVETGPAERVLREPEHAYTRRLLGAVPALPGPTAGLASVQPK